MFAVVACVGAKLVSTGFEDVPELLIFSSYVSVPACRRFQSVVSKVGHAIIVGG